MGFLIERYLRRSVPPTTLRRIVPRLPTECAERNTCAVGCRHIAARSLNNGYPQQHPFTRQTDKCKHGDDPFSSARLSIEVTMMDYPATELHIGPWLPRDEARDEPEFLQVRQHVFGDRWLNIPCLADFGGSHHSS